jgi:membrane-associated phospholipid phosphatase
LRKIISYFAGMNKLRSFFSLNPYYFTGLLLFFAVGFFFSLHSIRSEGFLYLTAYHSKFLDNFFIYYTNLGDGFFTVAVILLLLITRRFFYAWQILAAFLISGLLVQVLKNLIYSPRPMEFFKLKEHIYLIEGVTHTGSSSFPSGHSASAFALATLLALFARDKKIGCLYLLAAVLVGYSRIYLSQHFPMDVMTGAAIGVLIALLVYFFFMARKNRFRKRVAEKQ